MSIQKKILSMTIGPVVLLGLLSIFFMLTTVRSSMMEEIEEGLKGTAAVTIWNPVMATSGKAAIISPVPDVAITGFHIVMATSGKAAIISPVPRAWWIGSGTIQEWM